MANTTNPLDELADIQLPDGVSWWPLAPGWWILITLLLIMAAAIYYWRRHRQRNAYRQLAMAELQQAYQDFQQQQSSAMYLQNVSNILRRTAMSAYPQSFNSSIKGDDWLIWLDTHCSAMQDSFAQGTGRALLIGPYQKTPQVDITALQQLCTHWVLQHRNQWQKNKTPPVKTEAANV